MSTDIRSNQQLHEEAEKGVGGKGSLEVSQSDLGSRGLILATHLFQLLLCIKPSLDFP